MKEAHMTVMTAEPRPADVLERLEEPTLYDVFYEAGTMLGGTLVALADKAEADGRVDDERSWMAEHSRLLRERATVGADDREGQIAAKLRWDARRERLSRLI